MADPSDTPISSEEDTRDRTTRRDLLRRAGIGAAAVAAAGAGSGGALARTRVQGATRFA